MYSVATTQNKWLINFTDMSFIVKYNRLERMPVGLYSYRKYAQKGRCVCCQLEQVQEILARLPHYGKKARVGF